MYGHKALFKADITTKDNAITNQNDGKKIPSINKSSGGKDNSSFTPGVLVTERYKIKEALVLVILWLLLVPLHIKNHLIEGLYW